MSTTAKTRQRPPRIQSAKINQHPERSVEPEAASILEQGMVAHLGFCQREQPFVIPFSYHYDSEQPDRLYVHGGRNNRALEHVADGAPVCVEVTLLDGLVYSRSAMYHSMNYRSVVAFGRARRVTSAAEKRTVFAQMVDRYFPGRTEGVDYDAPPATHLEATSLLEVKITEWSAKARRGGPAGPRDADSDAPGSCGVIELPGR